MNCLIEICCGDIESVIAAANGGADRIELCSALSEGGLTPSTGLIAEAVRCGSTVNVLIRPRRGDFIYSKAETEVMLHDIRTAAALGANGIVAGALNADGSIDIYTCKCLISEAKSHGLEVTFHRAFDMCADPYVALEAIIHMQADRILTSGLAATALEGAETLRKLREIACGRIKIMAGCGVTPENVSEILIRTGVGEIHASAKKSIGSSMRFRNESAKMGNEDSDEFSRTITSEKTVRQLVEIIHNHES